MKNIILEHKNHVSILTINRPESLNALNAEVLNEIKSTVLEVEEDQNSRVLVITGAGKAFVAGADISQMCDMSPIQALQFADLGNRVFKTIEELRVPTIAAVNGFALGGGCELSLACDLRYASSKAKFGQPEVTLGITPGFGGTQRLSRTVGTSLAMELILTGKTIDAATAKSIGLVNEVYSPETLMDEVMAIAEKIATNAPLAVQRSKKDIQRFTCLRISEDLDFEAQNFSECFSTNDQKQAMTAFLEKRPHDEFKGN